MTNGDETAKRDEPRQRRQSAPATAADLGQLMHNGYADYVGAVSSLRRDVSLRCWDNGLSYLSELQAALHEAHAKTANAYRDLNRAVAEAYGLDDQQAARRRIAESIQAFYQSASEITAAAFARIRELQQRHAKSANDLMHDTKAKSDAAYRAFAQSVKEAWVGAAVGDVDPVSLAAAARLATAGAIVATYTRGTY
jgi:hypothetical protein